MGDKKRGMGGTESAALRRIINVGSPENHFTTELTPEGESAFKEWKNRTAPWDSGEDYDLRGAWAEGMERDGIDHLPDTYKKPNHETFSDESVYRVYEPESAGRWDGDKYVQKGPPLWLRQYMMASQR